MDSESFALSFAFEIPWVENSFIWLELHWWQVSLLVSEEQCSTNYIHKCSSITTVFCSGVLTASPTKKTTLFFIVRKCVYWKLKGMLNGKSTQKLISPKRVGDAPQVLCTYLCCMTAAQTFVFLNYVIAQSMHGAPQDKKFDFWNEEMQRDKIWLHWSNFKSMQVDLCTPSNWFGKNNLTSFLAATVPNVCDTYSNTTLFKFWL